MLVSSLQEAEDVFALPHILMELQHVTSYAWLPHFPKIQLPLWQLCLGKAEQ